jgi:hypothetical protein
MYHITAGKEVFTRPDGSSVGATRWGIWALLIDHQYVNDKPLPQVTPGGVW